MIWFFLSPPWVRPKRSIVITNQRKEGLCKVRVLSGAVADAEPTGRAGEEGEGGGGRVGGRGRGRRHPVQQELPLP